MKKIAAGLLTAFCATAFSFAQTAEQVAQDNWVDAQPAAQADGSFNAQAQTYRCNSYVPIRRDRYKSFKRYFGP